jgi:hypothetical protein
MSTHESAILTAERDAQRDARNHQDRGEQRRVCGIAHDDRDLPSADEVED